MSHKSRLGVLVIDCKTDDLPGAAAFWSGALGYDADIDPAFPDYVRLATPDGELRVLLQAVDHEPRIHMDIMTDNRAAERDRMLALGASVVREVDEDGKHWTVLEAPTGHRYCLVSAKGEDFETKANVWGDG
ncbi:MAG: VOC family protein [Pseudomonadota bacterium]